MFLWQEGKRHGVGSFSAYLCQSELLQFPLLALHLTRLRVDRASSHLGWCQVVSCIYHEQAFVLSCWLCCKPGLYRWWKWLIVTLVNVDLKASWQRFPDPAGNFSSLHSTENEDPWMLLKKHPNHQRISRELWNISSVQSGKAALCCIGPSAPHALQKSLHV